MSKPWTRFGGVVMDSGGKGGGVEVGGVGTGTEGREQTEDGV